MLTSTFGCKEEAVKIAQDRANAMGYAMVAYEVNDGKWSYGSENWFHSSDWFGDYVVVVPEVVT